MSLQQRAETIAKNLNLQNLLEKYGEAHLVGNVALKTTVKPDIDVQIYAKPEKWKNNSALIANDFSKLGIHTYISRSLKESNKYLTSFTYPEGGESWTIDVTQTEPNEDYLKDAYTFYMKYIGLLTEEKTETIKKIKQYFFEKGMLHHSMSYYIYRAVLDENAKSVGDIYNYLSDNKIYLGKFKNNC